jgi:hypothetical protein
MESWRLRLAGLNSPEGEDSRGRKPSACANALRLGLRAESLGVTPVSQTGGWGMDEERAATRESGAVDAGLRRASLSPHSKTLSRLRGRWSLLPSCLVTYCMVTAERDDKKRAAIAGRPRGFGVVIDEAPVAAQLGYFSSGSDRSCRGLRRGRRCSRPVPWRGS